MFLPELSILKNIFFQTTYLFFPTQKHFDSADWVLTGRTTNQPTVVNDANLDTIVEPPTAEGHPMTHQSSEEDLTH